MQHPFVAARKANPFPVGRCAMAGQHGSYSSSAAQVAMLMPSAPPKDTAAKNLRGADIAAGGHQKKFEGTNAAQRKRSRAC